MSEFFKTSNGINYKLMGDYFSLENIIKLSSRYFLIYLILGLIVEESGITIFIIQSTFK
jgi:hypothetical protein